MNSTENAYGLWSLVIINSLFFILFAYTFFKPQSSRDWRTLGLYSAFILALFAEMYGFPLTIYFLSGWLTEKFPAVNWLSHDAGHLLEMTLGWRNNPHFGPFHILSILFNGSALAASVAMQTMGGDCPAATAQADGPNAHHHDQSSAHQDHSSVQHDQQSSVCQDCGICHFACGGYLATVAIEMTEARPSAITYASSSTQFQSFTSAPLYPPPLSRVSWQPFVAVYLHNFCNRCGT